MRGTGQVTAAMVRAVSILALLSFAACSAAKETAELPGLHDLRPIGPAGQNCYETCSRKYNNCASMCPHASADCTDECMAHTKTCLAACPELTRTR